VFQRKDVAQALCTIRSFNSDGDAGKTKQKANGRLGRKIRSEKAISDAKVVNLQEEVGKKALALLQEKAAHREILIDKREHQRLIREHEAERTRRWGKERERAMRVAGNMERAAQMEAAEAKSGGGAGGRGAGKSGRRENAERWGVEKENKQLTGALPFVAVAAAHADANAAEMEMQKGGEETAE
jgi:hypothetical protein